MFERQHLIDLSHLQTEETYQDQQSEKQLPHSWSPDIAHFFATPPDWYLTLALCYHLSFPASPDLTSGSKVCLSVFDNAERSLAFWARLPCGPPAATCLTFSKSRLLFLSVLSPESLDALLAGVCCSQVIGCPRALCKIFPPSSVTAIARPRSLSYTLPSFTLAVSVTTEGGGREHGVRQRQTLQWSCSSSSNEVTAASKGFIGGKVAGDLKKR